MADAKVGCFINPSVSSLIALRARAASPNSASFVGFGDPFFSPGQAKVAKGDAQANGNITSRGVRLTPRGAIENSQMSHVGIEQLERLPDTRNELLQVAKSLEADPGKDIYVGEKASRNTIRHMQLADKKIVFFATHALLPGDLDGLYQPALAFSAPSVTGVADDGLLTMDDIMKLKLDADWVVLSACNTAAEQGVGAESTSGLSRAFFYAGARAVLVTQWSVESSSAALLTAQLFDIKHREASLTRSQALQKSMLELIDKKSLSAGTTSISYAHPFFWAPYRIIGDGGR